MAAILNNKEQITNNEISPPELSLFVIRYSLFFLRLVDVRRLAEEHLGGFHQRLAERGMRMNGQLEARGVHPHRDGDAPFRNQFTCPRSRKTDAEDALSL